MNCCEVLLLAVYTADNQQNTEHLGLELLATVLGNCGISCSIEIVYTDDMLGDAQIMALVGDTATLVGVTVDFNTECFVNRLTLRMKMLCPHVHITSGGNYATQMGEEILVNCSAVDSVLLGEAERTILILWRALQNGGYPEICEGIVFRTHGGDLARREQKRLLNMEEIPFADRSMAKTTIGSYIRLQTSRGCQGGCSFCTEASMYAGTPLKWRGRAAEEVVEEIKGLYSGCGARHFTFVDSSFEDSREEQKNRVHRICELILEAELDIYFLTLMRCDSFCTPADARTVELLARAGLVEAFLGVESFSDQTLKLLGKRASAGDNLYAVNLFRECGVNYVIGFIMFHPYTTLPEIDHNIDCLTACGQIHRYTAISNALMLYRNTRIFKRVERDGLLDGFSALNPQGYRCGDSGADSVRRSFLAMNSNSPVTIKIIHQLEGNLLYLDRLIAKIRKSHGKAVAVELSEQSAVVKAALGQRYEELFHAAAEKGTAVTDDFVQRHFALHLRDSYLTALTEDMQKTIGRFVKRHVGICDGLL